MLLKFQKGLVLILISDPTSPSFRTDPMGIFLKHRGTEDTERGIGKRRFFNGEKPIKVLEF